MLSKPARCLGATCRGRTERSYLDRASGDCPQTRHLACACFLPRQSMPTDACHTSVFSGINLTRFRQMLRQNARRRIHEWQCLQTFVTCSLFVRCPTSRDSPSQIFRVAGLNLCVQYRHKPDSSQKPLFFDFAVASQKTLVLNDINVCCGNCLQKNLIPSTNINIFFSILPTCPLCDVL